MIYVDEIRNYGKKGNWCHMWTDGDDGDLDTFAKTIGLKPSWAHTSNGLSGRFYHYDLTPNKRQQALQNGAKVMTLRDWLCKKIEERQYDESEDG